MLIRLSDIILYRTFKTAIKLVLTDIVLIHFYQFKGSIIIMLILNLKIYF